MLIEQISEFELRGPGPPGRKYASKLVIFKTKQDSFKEDFRVDCYLLPKYCRRKCVLLLSICANSLTKFNAEMEDFTMFWV